MVQESGDHQLSLAVDPVICVHPRWLAGFLNRQQHVWIYFRGVCGQTTHIKDTKINTSRESSWDRCPPFNWHSTWKLMVERLFSFWEGLFSGAILVLGRVNEDKDNMYLQIMDIWQKKSYLSGSFTCPEKTTSTRKLCCKFHVFVTTRIVSPNT